MESSMASSSRDIQSGGSIKTNQATTISAKNITLEYNQFPLNENGIKDCEECQNDFIKSFLYKNFAVKICDHCRDSKGVHELITRTEAKNNYILKDCDLDLRQPPLRYVLKKNPYANRGDMRLYLKYQIEERAIEVHGSEKQVEENLEKREERRVIKKQRIHERRIKTLNMQVRSSLYKRKTELHEHEYDDPVCIDEDKDLYRKICKTCRFQIEFEEM